MPHISVTDQCKSNLDKLKSHPRVSYREVIEDLMRFKEAHLVESKGEEPATGIVLEPIPQTSTE